MAQDISFDDDFDIADDLDFGDEIDLESSVGDVLMGRTTAARTASRPGTVRAVRVSSQPGVRVTAHTLPVRKGTIPGAAIGGMIGGIPGAIAGGLLGHLSSNPIVSGINAELSPSIRSIQQALQAQALQRRATYEHNAINARDNFQRRLLEKVSRIERLVASPHLRSL